MNEAARKGQETRRLLGPRIVKIPFDKPPPQATLPPRRDTRRKPAGRGPAA